MSIQVSDAGTEIYNPPKDNKAAWAWKKAYDGQARVLSKAMTKVHEQAEKLAAINKLDKPMDIHLSAADKLEAAKTGNRVITRCPNCKSDISESNSTRVTDYKYCPYCRQALNFKIQV